MKISHALLLTVALLPMACTSNPHPAGKPLPALTFNYLQGIPVNVQAIEVQMIPVQAPTDFVILPGRVLNDYLHSRFSAQGQRDKLRAVVTEAKVTSSRKASEGGVRRFLDVDNHDVYQVNMTIRFEHVTDTGQILYAKELKASRTMNISEHVSVAEREQHQFRGMEQMFSEMDTRITDMVINGMRLGSFAR